MPSRSSGGTIIPRNYGSAPTARPRERAFLVGVELARGAGNLLTLDDSLNELALLAETAGLDVVGRDYQKLESPNPKTFIGAGKVEEVKVLAEEVAAEVILFDEELSPRHLRELERAFGDGVRLLDRTALILDIFAQHAHTSEGALQVELAQYNYFLPRLTRQWTHLARQAGGGGGRSGSVGGVGLRGPGETQLEVDRREIRHKIGTLKRRLEKVRLHRQQDRARRKRARLPVVALVGYTNAGKSTLLNRLTDANVYVADQLFATLDPTTRRVALPGIGTTVPHGTTVPPRLALFTDTVGFIQKLQTALIAAFRATLEEIAEADLLLHVVDVTHPNAQAQAKAVYQTLADIEAGEVPTLVVLNKIDRLADGELARRACLNYCSARNYCSASPFPNAVAISALTVEGIPDLLQRVSSLLFDTFVPLTVVLP